MICGRQATLGKCLAGPNNLSQACLRGRGLPVWHKHADGLQVVGRARMHQRSSNSSVATSLCMPSTGRPGGRDRHPGTACACSDLEAALLCGVKEFQPSMMAEASTEPPRCVPRGFSPASQPAPPLSREILDVRCAGQLRAQTAAWWPEASVMLRRRTPRRPRRPMQVCAARRAAEGAGG